MTFGYKPHPTSAMKMGDRKKARHAAFAYNKSIRALKKAEKKKARKACFEALAPEAEAVS